MKEVDADAYLAFAVDCPQKARHEIEDRWMYVAIANAWVKLADHAEAEAVPEAEANAPAFH
jgi:hypothetical protein